CTFWTWASLVEATTSSSCFTPRNSCPGEAQLSTQQARSSASMRILRDYSRPQPATTLAPRCPNMWQRARPMLAPPFHCILGRSRRTLHQSPGPVKKRKFCLKKYLPRLIFCCAAPSAPSASLTRPWFVFFARHEGHFLVGSHLSSEFS